METTRHHRRGDQIVLLFLAITLSLLLASCTDPITEPVQPGVQPPMGRTSSLSGGVYFDGMNFISVPDPNWPAIPWEGDLVIYAHGYYAPADDPWTPAKDEVDGTPIAGIVNNLGYAYASTSYSGQGLVVPAAVNDILTLAATFKLLNGVSPAHIYLVGPSEGGLVTTLAVEKRPDIFSGGMSMCGPIGDFRKQLDYFGDFHLLYNYFFPGNVIPGSPAGIPDVTQDTPIPRAEWEAVYTPAIQLALASNPSATGQLLKVSRAPIDPADPATVQKTVLDILWYNVFATNDAIHRLGGSPFNNRSPFRIYFGSDNDIRLNLRIPRYSASPGALASIARGFQTTGRIAVPLVTLHTTGDPIIPYWHATLYSVKALAAGSMLKHTHVPILRYGHCQFKVYEVLAGFAVLVLKVTARELIVTERAVPDPAERARIIGLAGTHGARPKVVRELEGKK